MKYITTKRTGYSLNPGIYEILVINTTLKYILPDNVKVSVTNKNDNRLKSNLKINQTSIFTKRSFFCAISGFIQSNSGPLGDIDGSIQLIPGTYKSDRPIKFTAIDKVHLKCECIIGSVVNAIRQPIFYSFALSSPPGHKRYNQPRVKFFKKIEKTCSDSNNILSRR